jgi:ABC-type glycerol-3-phosphate transport system substrate-binding protein
MDDEYGYGSGYEVYTLLQFDMNGQQLSTQVLTGPEDADYFYVGDMQTDLAGNLYLQGDNFVMVLDSQGQQLATVTVPNWISQVVTLPDGQVMLYYYNEDYEQALGYLDPATWEIGSSILMEVPNDSYVYTYYAGSDGQLYASNTMGLYHCNLQNGTMEQMLEWLDCNINAYSVYGRAIVSEELVLSVGTDDVTRNYQLTTLTRVPADQIPQKIELTMGVTWLSYNARELILNFNRTNSEYSITIKDYSVYNTDDDYTAAQTQMERDMISGNCPDILFLDSTDTIERYVSKGILVDLYTLMGPDTVEADDLVDTYRRIMEVDGGLYCIYPTFCIDTMLGASSVVGTESGWTLAEFSALAQEYAARDAVLWSYMTREEALTTLLSYNYDTFVDRESGQCSFDGAEFQALLETCALFPEDYSYYNDRYDQDLQYSSSLDQMRVGDLLVQFSSIYALEDMRYDLDTLADDLTFIGIPGVEGNGAVLSTSSGYAISAQSPYQDVAWQFLSTMLTEDYAENKVYNLSVLKSYLAKQAEAAQEKPYYIDDDGNKVEYSDTALTQAQVDRLLDIIDNVEGRYTYDDDLMEIVLDESAAYFAGQKTAADVANLIQSRVQIYLDEQQ